MTLEEKVMQEMKEAMKAKDQVKLEAIRAIKSAILLQKTSADGYNPDTEIKMLQKLVKQRKDAAEIYTQQNRKDLADVEIEQADVIANFLPAQMSDAEITEQVKVLIAQTGAKSASETGKVMGLASKHFAGKADNKRVADIIKQLLS
jgi:uncharacterized protein YqeY